MGYMNSGQIQSILAIMKNLFLLGGYDLEMLTILDLLQKKQQEYRDKRLSWEGARLKQYADELQQFGDNKEYTIYGIELDESELESPIPNNYRAIDHHNGREDEPSALEQVCAVLGIEMDKDKNLQLVAANDTGYIPAMQELDATEDQIKDIRHKDRKAQGVTEEEESSAELAIKQAENVHGLLCVESSSKRFSPIADRLYGEFPRSLVYTDEEFTYYGWGRNKVRDILKKEYPNVSFYYGGGKHGYVGAGPCDSDTLKRIIEKIKTIDMDYSGHIFLFPFSWEASKGINKKRSRKKRLDLLRERTAGDWVRTPLPSKVDDEDLYNEMNFFYPFTHETIYDKEGDSRNLWHFERRELQPDRAKAEYVIKTKAKDYVLDLVSVNINLYETGVGLLSFYTRNYQYKDPQEILNINQFGRRVFLPFKAALQEDEVPRAIEIKGLNKDYSHDFTNQDIQPNSPMEFISKLINEAIENIQSISPVLDDRMFVMSWYKYSDMDFTQNSVFESMMSNGKGGNDFLYKYAFVDHKDTTCQNEEMTKGLLKEAVYPRWQKYGTLYGISRYSFVMLTTESCPEYLLKYFETEYVRMVELVLIQRASILHLSSLLRTRDEKEFTRYYHQYIDFLSRFRFPEVSAQDQAIELYDMLCKIMRIHEHADYLDKQFNEREEYYELQNQGKLNMLAGLAVPFSIISALFGFFFRDSLNAVESGTLSGFWASSWPGWIAFIITAILTGLFVSLFIRRRNQN